MSFLKFHSPGDVLTSEKSFDEMAEVLEAWRDTTRAKLRSDDEGMSTAQGAGDEHRRVEKALEMLALARRAREVDPRVS